MNKTLQMEKEDLLLEIIERIKEETVSFNIYGTDKEEAFLSGINEGIDRVLDALQQFDLQDNTEVCDCPESGVYFMECDICRGQK